MIVHVCQLHHEVRKRETRQPIPRKPCSSPADSRGRPQVEPPQPWREGARHQEPQWPHLHPAEASPLITEMAFNIFNMKIRLNVFVWVLSGYPGFLPPSKDLHVRLTGVSKLSLGVNVSVCVVVCLYVALWWTGNLPRMYPMTAGIGSSPPATRPTD